MLVLTWSCTQSELKAFISYAFILLCIHGIYIAMHEYSMHLAMAEGSP